MFNKVFISYASEDYGTACNIYDFLSMHDYLPWLDKKKLLPGEKWDYRIKKELRESDFIILLLSSISVAKRGYVQKEFKKSVEYSEEKLYSDIFIIPIKIDDCDVPDELSSFQWAKFGSTNLEESILKSLNTQRNKLVSSLPSNIATLNNYQIEFSDFELGILKNTNCTVKYPVFLNSNSVNTSMLNTAIKHYVDLSVSKVYNDFDWAEDNDSTELELKNIPQSTFDVSFKTGIINQEFISILFEEYTYYHGAAHPNYYYKAINCLFKPNHFPDRYIISNLKDLKQLVTKYKHEYEDSISYMSESIDWFFEQGIPKDF